MDRKNRNRCQGLDELGDWRQFPHLKRHGHYYTAACPIHGGKDRISIYPAASGSVRVPHMWCRFCDMYKPLDPGPKVGKVVAQWQATEPHVDEADIERYHRSLNGHHVYFEEKGIPQNLISAHKLGFKTEWGGHYVIPCYVTGTYGGVTYDNKLFAAQLRSAQKDAPHKRRYLTEPGSVNNVPFNTPFVYGKTGAAVFIIEGPRDCIAMYARGYYAVAPFRGNNKFKSWERAWNPCLYGFLDRIIVPDNTAEGKPSDDGMLIALSKQNEIPGSRILALPRGYKDVGDFIERGGNLFAWSQVPPFRPAK
jgi:hypothetical protein